jgi:type II secretory pathway pseudopilin PulG
MDQRGFTLIEVVVVAGCLVVMILAIGATILASQDNYAAGMTLSSLQNHAQSVMDKIAKEVRQSGPLTFFPVPSNTDNLTFQKSVGYSGGAVQWGNAITYAFQYETGENDDGVDNNGNGLIDEGIIVRTENGQNITIARWVREGGFLFFLSGDVLTIQLTLERRNSKGRIFNATVTTSVDVKN